MPNGYMGPSYRRSAIWGEQEQRKALGMTPLTPAATAAAVRGELEPYYAFQLSAREKERQAGYEEERLGFEEERLGIAKTAERRMMKKTEAEERAGTVSGIAQLGLTGATVAPYVSKAGTALGLWGGPAAAAGGLVGGAAQAAAVGGGAMAGLAPTLGATAATMGTAVPAGATAGAIGGAAGGTIAGVSTSVALPVIGVVVGGLIAIFGKKLCCWTFLEGEMLTENVRKYRDSHYDKITSPVSWGYRWMSTWLVPLMKKHKSIKSLVKWSMLKPLASYADWYYGDNSYGWLFYPLKEFWTNFWRVSGLKIQSLVEIRNANF